MVQVGTCDQVFFSTLGPTSSTSHYTHTHILLLLKSGYTISTNIYVTGFIFNFSKKDYIYNHFLIDCTLGMKKSSISYPWLSGFLKGHTGPSTPDPLPPRLLVTTLVAPAPLVLAPSPLHLLGR